MPFGWKSKEAQSPHETGCSISKSSLPEAFDELGYTPPLNLVECAFFGLRGDADIAFRGPIIEQGGDQRSERHPLFIDRQGFGDENFLLAAQGLLHPQ